jgi:hypothetical protein
MTGDANVQDNTLLVIEHEDTLAVVEAGTLNTLCSILVDSVSVLSATAALPPFDELVAPDWLYEK